MFELDEDGYPTEETIKNILSFWDVDGKLNALNLAEKPFRSLMDNIKTIWRFGEYGYWEEKIEPYELDSNIKVYRWYISTAGWSGNEEIIDALQKVADGLIWYEHWVESKRGGHYVFEERITDIFNKAMTKNEKTIAFAKSPKVTIKSQ